MLGKCCAFPELADRDRMFAEFSWPEYVRAHQPAGVDEGLSRCPGMPNSSLQATRPGCGFGMMIDLPGA
jgi:hypothetical protein